MCARLDNLPLAVELAAARAAAIPPAALLERLSSRLDVLKGPRDADERQRTLRATIAWSHDLLEEEEQKAFRRLAIFPAGATLEAVETVCEADLEEILSLVAQSLVRQTQTAGEEPRYWMLETIREFAATMLADAGEADAYAGRHLDWYADLARKARDKLVGPGSSEWLDRLELDRENLRAAFGSALERARHGGEDAAGVHGGAGVSLGIVLTALHVLHGRYAEAEDVLRATLALQPPPFDSALLRSRLGRVLRQRGRFEEALEAHLAAEHVLDNMAARDEEWWRAWIDVKLYQANHYYFQAAVVELARLIEDVRPHLERHGSALQELDFLHVMAQNAYRRERYVLSDETELLIRRIHRRSLELEDTHADFTLGFGLLWREKLAEAESAFQRGLASARSRGDALIEVRCLVYQTLSLRKRGDVEGVRALLGELDALKDLQGYTTPGSSGRTRLGSRTEMETTTRLSRSPRLRSTTGSQRVDPGRPCFSGRRASRWSESTSRAIERNPLSRIPARCWTRLSRHCRPSYTPWSIARSKSTTPRFCNARSTMPGRAATPDAWDGEANRSTQHE